MHKNKFQKNVNEIWRVTEKKFIFAMQKMKSMLRNKSLHIAENGFQPEFWLSARQVCMY